jgi:hypothetical protein
MRDAEILDTIDRLAEEERTLREREAGEEGASSEQLHARHQRVEVLLDQLWDLLRQRRARREMGLDPEEASMRDEETVENYLQ